MATETQVACAFAAAAHEMAGILSELWNRGGVWNIPARTNNTGNIRIVFMLALMATLFSCLLLKRRRATKIRLCRRRPFPRTIKDYMYRFSVFAELPCSQLHTVYPKTKNPLLFYPRLSELEYETIFTYWLITPCSGQLPLPPHRWAQKANRRVAFSTIFWI